MFFSEKFYCASKEISTIDHPIANPQFRKSFTIERIPASAEITICGLGYYELYLNGQNITKGFLAPYRSNPDHYAYYDNYNVSDYLTEGENVVGVVLGNGLTNSDNPVWDFDKASFRAAPKLALAVEIDGKILFEADQMKWTESPILLDEYHYGEIYDARNEIEGWKNCGYDDSEWKAAIPAEKAKGEARIPDCESIGIIDVHYPVRITKSKRGYVYDFAVNCAGLCELKIKGTRGQKVELTYGEMLREGELDRSNITFANKTISPQYNTYTLKGGSVETYMPHFTFFGFRFVEVVGITEEQATFDLLTFYEMSSSMRQTADFHCDCADINAIFDATMRSNRSNFIYFPLDCPQREKNGWTGDAALSAEQHLIYLDCARSMKEWLKNIYKSQTELGAIPGIIPTDTWGYAWGAGPAWDNVMFEYLYRLHQYTGEVEAIREAYPYLMKYLHYMESKRDEKGLLHYGLDDWCHVNRGTRETVIILPHTDTITCKSICDKAALLFSLIGEDDAAEYARSLSDSLKQSYLSHCASLKNQTTCAMGIYYGIFENEMKEDAFIRMVRSIKNHGNHMDVGVLGYRALFRVLGERDETELALDMILNDVPPSYKCNIDLGCTALREDFNYIDAPRIDQLSNDDPIHIASLNHHFWGDVIAFFMRHIAGIQIESVSKVRIAPGFSRRINNVSAYSTLPAGQVSVTYKKCDIKIDMTVNVPTGVEATVVAPAGYRLVHGKAKCKSGENHLIFCKE